MVNSSLLSSIPLLLIRADAGADIGVGHVMRCLALAQTWQDQGGRAAIALTPGGEALNDRLCSSGVEVTVIDVERGSDTDADVTARVARDAVAVVADGYRFGTSYQRRLHDKLDGSPLMVIDDYGHADRYVADFVLNQNASASPALYSSRETYTRLLLGTQYALIRREFSGSRPTGRFPVRAERLLVTMGGADVAHLLPRVLDALERLGTEAPQATIVLGSTTPHADYIVERAAELPTPAQVVRDVRDMKRLMEGSDFALVASGSVVWELAYCNVPTLAVVVAENQKAHTQHLAESGACHTLGWHESVTSTVLADAIASLARDTLARRSMTEAGAKVIDGRGAERVVKELYPPFFQVS